MNNYFIVREDCSDIRAIAREALRGKWGEMMLLTALYLFLAQGVALILACVFPAFSEDSVFYATHFSFAEWLYTVLTGGTFAFGYIALMLATFRKQPTGVGKLFEGFEQFVKLTAMTIMIGIFTVLWSCLLIIPGIVAAYSYSQAYNIMHDHPEYGIFKCIRESKKLMYGNKMKLFVLTLSYIGWIMLIMIPSTAVTMAIGLKANASNVYFMTTAASFVALMMMTPIVLYICMGVIVFYEMAKGNLVRQPLEVVSASMPSVTTMENISDPIASMAKDVMVSEKPGNAEEPVSLEKPQMEEDAKNEANNGIVEITRSEEAVANGVAKIEEAPEVAETAVTEEIKKEE